MQEHVPELAPAGTVPGLMCPEPPYFLPVRRINCDAAARYPRHTGAELGISGFLLVAEKHIAMINYPIDLQYRYGAQPALAASTIKDHVNTGALERPRRHLHVGDSGRSHSNRTSTQI
jgi:hypothetical protein